MKKHLAVGIVAGLLTIIVLLGAGSQKVNPLGFGGGIVEFAATNTTSVSASANTSWAACTSGGTLGSIVINQPASAGSLVAWDATTTSTSTIASTDTSLNTGSKTVGRKLATISSASDVVGTLDYNSRGYAGIVLETTSGFDGNYTVTYRCN